MKKANSVNTSQEANKIKLVSCNTKNKNPPIVKAYKELIMDTQEWINSLPDKGSGEQSNNPTDKEEKEYYQSWFDSDKKRCIAHCYQERQYYLPESNLYSDLLDFLYIEDGVLRIAIEDTVTIEQLRDFTNDHESETKEGLISTIISDYGFNDTDNYVNNMDSLKEDLKNNGIEFTLDFLGGNQPNDICIIKQTDS